MRILNTILLVLILFAIAGAGAAYYYLNSGNEQQVSLANSEPMAPVVAAPIFLALEPFTVTIRGERSSQILYTEVTLRLDHTHSHTALVQYMPEVRNRVLAEMAQHTASDLQTPDGRDRLAARLKTILSQQFHPQMAAPSISQVLFTAFVIQ